jgi:hypothetical protein
VNGGGEFCARLVKITSESSVRPEFETSHVEPLAQVIVVGNRMEKPRQILDIILRMT